MRKVVAAVLFALTGACLLLAGMVVSNVFADYKDSSDSTYIETAAVPFALGLLFLAGGVMAFATAPDSAFDSAC
jgi:heme/copper-type cytochrome/quinol oxidase subunit 3